MKLIISYDERKNFGVVKTDKTVIGEFYMLESQTWILKIFDMASVKEFRSRQALNKWVVDKYRRA